MSAVHDRKDLLVLREAALARLREDEIAVRDHVELPLGAQCVRGVDPDAPQLGRETRGPDVVARSGGAVEDLDLHVSARTRFRARHARSRR